MNGRVGILLPNLHQGGAQRAAIVVANELADRHGYSVALIILEPSTFYREEIAPSVEVIELYDRPHRSRVGRLFETYIHRARRLNAVIDWSEYDYLVAGWEGVAEIALIGLLVLNSRRLTDVRRRLVSVIQVLPSGIVADATPLGRLRERLLAVLRIRAFSQVVAVSSAIRDEIGDCTACRVHVIPNPVDVSKAVRLASEEPKFEPTNDARPFFLNVARVSPQKNQLLLVRAFATIKDWVPHDVIVLGECYDVTLRSEIELEIERMGLSGRVRLLGAVANPFLYMARATALVMSSDYEGTPLTVLEAMSIGCPVVSTTFPGCSDLLSTDNCLLAPVRDPVALGQCMLRIALGDVELARRLELARKAAESCSVERVAARYRDVLSPVVTTTGEGPS